MFAFVQLINENALRREKFSALQERAEKSTFSNAQIMFKALTIIRRNFCETANKPVENIKLTDDKTASLFGLRFDYNSRVWDSERTKQAENTSESVDSSLKLKS